jgi:hypothetical protein
VKRKVALAAGGAGALLAVTALLAPLARAHGLQGRADLPIPSWLFGWGAAIVLAVSFVALSALWQKPQLQKPVERPLFRIPGAVDLICGALGIAGYLAVVYAGFAGEQTETNANLAPTAIYVEFWVGLVVVSLVFGDVFRAFNPWRSFALAVRWLARGRGWRTRPYPEKWGRWPAVAGIVCFAWLELASNPATKAEPSKLAALAVADAAIQLVGMAVFGIDTWSDNADAFGVYFNLFSRLSVFERRDGVLHLRRPLSGVPAWRIVPGSVALVCVAIGSTTFDGFSNGPVWERLGPDLQSVFKDLGSGATTRLVLANTIGLVACIALVGGFYQLGIKGMETVGGGHRSRELVGQFAHTLIPIAFAYALAHYFSLLIYNGQAIGYLVSNPLGHHANLFGTAHATIDYGIIAGSGIWYVQVGALVAGHVSGLVLAHDRALSIYQRVREATRSQYWMLVVMVGFTSLGLWLLSAVSVTSGG